MNISKLLSVYLLALFVFSSCVVKSGEIMNNKAVIVIPTGEKITDACERFVGNWEVRLINDNEIDRKKSCEKEPCYYWLNAGTLSMFCENKKISGKFVSKNDLPEKEIEIPINLSLENNTLSASFKNERECLYEFKVSPQDKVLSGKYKKTNCNQKIAHETDQEFTEGTEGSVLLANYEFLHNKSH